MQQAGLTHGGFYLHFASKEALAAEVVRQLLEQAAARWDHISRSPPGSRSATDRPVLSQSQHDRIERGLPADHARSRRRAPFSDARRDGRALRGMLDTLTQCIPGRNCAASAARRRRSCHHGRSRRAGAARGRPGTGGRMSGRRSSCDIGQRPCGRRAGEPDPADGGVERGAAKAATMPS